MPFRYHRLVVTLAVQLWVPNVINRRTISNSNASFCSWIFSDCAVKGDSDKGGTILVRLGCMDSQCRHAEQAQSARVQGWL